MPLLHYDLDPSWMNPHQQNIRSKFEQAYTGQAPFLLPT